MDRVVRAAAVFQLLWLSVLTTSLQLQADDKMKCFYCPLLENEKFEMYYKPTFFTELMDKKYQLIQVTCPSSQVCYRGDGRYGNYSALSSLGCMRKDQCNQVGSVRFKGVVYSQHYSCCDDQDFCNAGQCVTAKSVPLLLTLVLVTALGQMLCSW